VLSVAGALSVWSARAMTRATARAAAARSPLHDYLPTEVIYSLWPETVLGLVRRDLALSRWAGDRS